MTEEETLDQLIYDHAISCVEMFLDSAKGIYYRGAAGQIIFIDCTLEWKERIWTKAHEYGHAMTMRHAPTCLEDKRRSEAAADRYAYHLLMPPEKLVESRKRGIDDEETLSDFLMIPTDRIIRGLILYQDIYGLAYDCDGWIIKWLPLEIQHARSPDMAGMPDAAAWHELQQKYAARDMPQPQLTTLAELERRLAGSA